MARGKKEKKNYTVKVRSVKQTERVTEGGEYPCSPFVVTFPAGNNPLIEDAWEGIDVYASPDHLHKMDNYIVARASQGRGGLEYVGSSLTNTEPRTTKYVVGFLNQREQRLELIEPTSSSQIFGLSAYREDSLQNAWKQENKISAAESRNELLKTFGTAKAKRSINRIERVGSDLREADNLFFDSGEVFKWVSDRTETLVEEGKTEEQQLKALEISKRQMLPPHNLEATVAEEAYPVKNLVTAKAWKAIYALPVIKNLLNGDTSECCPFVQEHMAAYKDAASGSSEKMEKDLFMDVLSLFEVLNWVLKSRHTIRGNSVSDLADSIQLPYDFVEAMLPKLFSHVQGVGGRMEWVRSKSQKIGIQLYLLVLILTVEGFSVALGKLSNTLEASPKTIKSLCNELGCKLNKGEIVTLLKKGNESLKSQLPKVRLKRPRTR